MNPFIADTRRALECAGYRLQEILSPDGIRITGSRNGTNRPWFCVFGVTPEQAYLRACAAAEISVPSYFRVER